MKRTLVLSAVAVLLLSAASVFVYVNNEKNQMNDLFRANVEVLARYEIIVGPLCMECPNAACTSLGEVYEENIRV